MNWERLKKKLKSRRGESLTETLVALLIITLSAGLLAGGTTSAVRINERAIASAETFYEQFGTTETGVANPSDGVLQNVVITVGTSPYVENYTQTVLLTVTEDGGLRSYRVPWAAVPDDTGGAP